MSKAKALAVLLFVGLLGVMTVQLMNMGADGIVTAGSEFQKLAIKITIARVAIIGGVAFIAWGFIARLVAVYLRVEIGPLKYRFLFWYLAAESVLIWSVYRL